MTKGFRIKNRREELGISQTELATKIGTSKQNLYKYENNIITNIPSNIVEKLASVLQCSPGYLMGWEENIDDSGITDTVKSNDYYLDEETAREAQRVFNDPDTRMLFDAAKNSKPENIRLAAEMLKRFKETNPDG